ncbi:hypothetical protein [Natrinema halophilum]|uniref:Uncharacterized protein n=1 Tax=Natrinema halophilum TaxID=1699371 RepID=A0A7D5GLB7_9EURY|nr:hypothetical protein [Natrinema halophilum]QLG49352.1 hypothetical protein HYG82_10995 [Natrinema halophilum]
MESASDPDLSPGEYWIKPAIDLSDISLRDVLFGDLGYETEADGDRVHKYDVVRSGGTYVFDVFETNGSADSDWLPVSIPHYAYVFIEPEGDPRLVVEVDQGSSGYTILDPQTGEQLGTVAKSRRILGDWQLTNTEGDVVATTDQVDKSTPLLSSGTYVTWDVLGQDGAKIGQFQRGPAEGSSSDRLSAMQITCSRSRVSTDQCIAFAFVLLYEGSQSTIRPQHGP